MPCFSMNDGEIIIPVIGANLEREREICCTADILPFHTKGIKAIIVFGLGLACQA